MKRRVVVDVGNTRVKWGLCEGGSISAIAPLLSDDPAGWQTQFDAWRLDSKTDWAVAGVQPRHQQALVDWLRTRSSSVRQLVSARELPIVVRVPLPERVGLDRLLDAVAANHRRAVGEAVLIVDAGSAVTIDLVDAEGCFRGGAILPGLRLMAQSLHEHTALLPVVEIDAAASYPGVDTTHAIRAGILNAVAGAVERIGREAALSSPRPPQVFLTGGDAALLGALLGPDVVVSPEMTLAGIAWSAFADFDANH